MDPQDTSNASSSPRRQVAEEPAAGVQHTIVPTDPGPESCEREFRVWTDANGRQVDAALIEFFSDGRITLETRDGKTPTVPLAQFSQEDQSYVRRVRSTSQAVRPAKSQPKATATGGMAMGGMEFRTWTDRRGRQVEAALIACSEGKMTLRKRSGVRPTVPLAEFSKEDQDYVRQRAGGLPASDDEAPENDSQGHVVSRDDTAALIKSTEEGVVLGRELMDWWSGHAAELKMVRLSGKGEHLVEMKAFFDTMESSSGTTSVMGCIQKARFPIPDRSAAETPLEVFLKANYAVNATWSRPNGRPAGFGYDALLYKEKETGNIARFENGTSAAALDFTPVGSVNEWMMLRVEIYDFLRATPIKPLAGFLSRFVKEVAYIVSDEVYAAPVGDPPPGTVAECLFGYSFLPCAAVKGPFGFGPGHFKSAIKLFRFSLLESGELEIKLSFIVAPRSTKVLDLWGFDPVYTFFHFLNAVTLGLLRIKTKTHNAIDKNFMTVHGQVHHNLLNGMEDFWTGKRWVAD